MRKISLICLFAVWRQSGRLKKKPESIENTFRSNRKEFYCEWNFHLRLRKRKLRRTILTKNNFGAHGKMCHTLHLVWLLNILQIAETVKFARSSNFDLNKKKAKRFTPSANFIFVNIYSLCEKQSYLHWKIPKHQLKQKWTQYIWKKSLKNCFSNTIKSWKCKTYSRCWKSRKKKFSANSSQSFFIVLNCFYHFAFIRKGASFNG